MICNGVPLCGKSDCPILKQKTVYINSACVCFWVDLNVYVLEAELHGYARKKERRRWGGKGKMEADGEKMERVCAEQRRRRIWQLTCRQPTTETHGHDDRRRRPSPPLSTLLLNHAAVSWPKWPQLPYSSIGLAGNASWMMEFRLWAGL